MLSIKNNKFKQPEKKVISQWEMLKELRGNGS